jgi:2-methylisocitrate lyase-like PEP mutase family enzyme
MAMPGAPSIPTLVDLGVARVSVGPMVALAALRAVDRAARELLETGTYGALEGSLGYGEIEALFRRG